MRNEIIELAKACGADLVGFAPASRFEAEDPIFKLMPETKTVIGLGFRVLRGSHRGVEEGSTYYQYSTMGVENLEETVMPGALMRVSTLIEGEGFTALPQRRHQKIMAAENDTNPEVHTEMIYRGRTAETQMDFLNTAVKCGLGEIGFHGALLCDEFGPFIRYCFILTDAELDATPMYAPHLCDRCGECVKGCPGHAIGEDGKVRNWRCAVYYKGANGLKNPFMAPDAYPDMPDRLDIIAGNAKIENAEDAKGIIADTYFYPSISHGYVSSICGRACDVACYCHLEEKGVLTKKFREKFRTREPWAFDISHFDVKTEQGDK